MAAQLSWHVQNCLPNRSLVFKLENKNNTIKLIFWAHKMSVWHVPRWRIAPPKKESYDGLSQIFFRKTSPFIYPLVVDICQVQSSFGINSESLFLTLSSYIIPGSWNNFLCLFTSLWPSDPIWQHKSGSTLYQVMACCITAPSHYLNQCWLIINRDQLLSSKCNFTRDTSAINHWN